MALTRRSFLRNLGLSLVFLAVVLVAMIHLKYKVSNLHDDLEMLNKSITEASNKSRSANQILTDY
jgi:uncharacterized protein (UPF0333 family)